MGAQHKVREKRDRRKRYLKRKKEERKAMLAKSKQS